METLSTRVEPWLKEKVKEYAEQIDETQSVAARRLLQKGVEAEFQRPTVTWPFLLILLGFMFVSGAFFEVGDTLGLAGAALVILTVVDQQLGLHDRLT